MGDFPNKSTQFKPGQSGNPSGLPRGTKHLSTHIREMLEDEEFDKLLGGKTPVSFKGKPVKAIIRTAIIKSEEGDQKWADWLGKYGFGQKFEVDQNISGELKTGESNPELAAQFAEFLKKQTKQ